MRMIFWSPPAQNKLLATGQVTSYGSGTGVDDGALKKGTPKVYTVLTTGQFAGNTDITINSKTDTHANACVLDNKTGLMWSRTIAGSVGPTNNGKLPWTTTGAGATAEGIFPYVAAANAAALAGYTDWRISNITDLHSLIDYSINPPSPNTTAFPAFPQAAVWSSTTDSSATTYAVLIRCASSVGGIFVVSSQVKTDATRYAILVRGG